VFEFVFNSFVTLLVVVDPPGLAPIFVALTQGYPETRKREAAIRGTVLGTVILVLSRSRATRCSRLWGSASRRFG
jgi:multiple antibiotic resistance protein